MKRKILLVFFIALTGVFNTKAQENWVTFTKATLEEPMVTLQQSNTLALNLSYLNPDFYFISIEINHKRYTKPIINDNR